MTGAGITLEPVLGGYEQVIERFLTEPDTLGLDWSGFGNIAHFRARLRTDGLIGRDDGLLAIVDAGTCVGEASWQSTHYGGPVSTWRIGVGVLPEARGRGIARAAQTLLCEYLFANTIAERIEAVVRVDNDKERRAVEDIGFTCDGTLKHAEFKQGAWRDVALYSLLRPPPTEPPT